MKLPKYRAWDHDDKKMWKVVAMSESIYGDCEDSYIKVCEFDKSPMDKETDIRLSFNFDLMQFTGLYDKNGKEIYEGDIVRFHYKTGVYKIGTVVWNDLFGSWDIDCPDFVSYKSLGQYKSVSEVIGNIYENPELLEESK